jgi:hypothetical protein
MTVSELYRSVAQLGFEESLEYDDAFYFAANRAVLQINAIRPATRHCILRHRVPENRISGGTLDSVEKIEELCFYADNVKSYYFEADGLGILYIERMDEASSAWVIIDVVEFSGKSGFTPYRGFIKRGGEFVDGRVRMRFAGQYVYSLRGVAMYAHLYSDKVADVPAYEPYTRYDVSAMVPDFLGLASPPIDETEQLKRIDHGYDVENGRVILLSREAEGTYKVLYKRQPAVLVDEGSPSDDDTVIDLDADLAALMPVLVASYVWMDDEPEKAQYYLALYQEQAAELERRGRNMAPVNYRNVYGW